MGPKRVNSGFHVGQIWAIHLCPNYNLQQGIVRGPCGHSIWALFEPYIDYRLTSGNNIDLYNMLCLLDHYLHMFMFQLSVISLIWEMLWRKWLHAPHNGNRGYRTSSGLANNMNIRSLTLLDWDKIWQWPLTLQMRMLPFTWCRPYLEKKNTHTCILQHGK